jgi:fructose-1,6-bisphosphatase II
LFVATGITDGGLLSGVRRRGSVIETDSIILRSASGTVRRIRSEYQLENMDK